MNIEGKEAMIMQSCGQGIVWELRDDAAFLPLPYLVLNPNSHVFASLILKNYGGHAVPPRTTLYVFHMFMFLLNIPDFKLSLYILYWHFKGEKKNKNKQTNKRTRTKTETLNYVETIHFSFFLFLLVNCG